MYFETIPKINLLFMSQNNFIMREVSYFNWNLKAEGGIKCAAAGESLRVRAHPSHTNARFGGAHAGTSYPRHFKITFS